VGTFESRRDGVTGFLRRGTAGFGLGTGTETGLAELDLDRRKAAGQRLRVGVGGDEIHP
jgi:hypothetical protein